MIHRPATAPSRRRAASRTAAELARQDARKGVRATYDPLRPEVFALALDTREQLVAHVPLTIPIVVAKLPVGDLSVVGYEDRIAIDRKQLPDLICCLTQAKPRFFRLLLSLATLDFAAIVVEATVADVAKEKFRADVTAGFVFAAAANITTRYKIPVFFAGPLDVAMGWSLHLLRSWWRDRGLQRTRTVPEVSATNGG